MDIVEIWPLWEEVSYVKSSPKSPGPWIFNLTTALVQTEFSAILPLCLCSSHHFALFNSLTSQGSCKTSTVVHQNEGPLQSWPSSMVHFWRDTHESTWINHVSTMFLGYTHVNIKLIWGKKKPECMISLYGNIGSSNPHVFPLRIPNFICEYLDYIVIDSSLWCSVVLCCIILYATIWICVYVYVCVYVYAYAYLCASFVCIIHSVFCIVHCVLCIVYYVLPVLRLVYNALRIVYHVSCVVYCVLSCLYMYMYAVLSHVSCVVYYKYVLWILNSALCINYVLCVAWLCILCTFQYIYYISYILLHHIIVHIYIYIYIYYWYIILYITML